MTSAALCATSNPMTNIGPPPPPSISLSLSTTTTAQSQQKKSQQQSDVVAVNHNNNNNNNNNNTKEKDKHSNFSPLPPTTQKPPGPSSPKRPRRPPPLLIPTRPPTSLPTSFYPDSDESEPSPSTTHNGNDIDDNDDTTPRTPSSIFFSAKHNNANSKIEICEPSTIPSLIIQPSSSSSSMSIQPITSISSSSYKSSNDVQMKTCELEGIWNSDSRCAAATHKGRRRRINEDRVFGQPSLGIYGVCDGHGAESYFSSSSSPSVSISSSPSSIYSKSYNSVPAHKVAEILPRMLNEGYSYKEAFHNMDEQICALYPIKTYIGTTVTVVKIQRGHKLSVAHVGDSRAMIIKSNGECDYLTQDHLPTREDETSRIEQAGGHVLRGRVNGVLAVSRAIGDRALKSVVPAIPDVKERRLHASDQLLVLASDGLWDMISNVEVNDIIQSLEIEKGSVAVPCDLQHAAQTLVDEALARGSRDDTSVVLIDLRHNV